MVMLAMIFGQLRKVQFNLTISKLSSIKYKKDQVLPLIKAQDLEGAEALTALVAGPMEKYQKGIQN